MMKSKSFCSCCVSLLYRWVQSYRNLGFPVWGITVQNEPGRGCSSAVLSLCPSRTLEPVIFVVSAGENILTYEGMVFTPQSEADFVSTYLGPTMHKTGHADVNILYLDHSKDRLQAWAEVVMADPNATQYLWGVAVHWCVSIGYSFPARRDCVVRWCLFVFMCSSVCGSWPAFLHPCVCLAAVNRYTGDHFDALANVSASYPNFGTQRGQWLCFRRGAGASGMGGIEGG